MQRRKFLVGMGSLAAGGAAAMGTGAFTTVEADRSVEVAVAGDASAFLKLVPARDDDNTGAGYNPNAPLHENAAEYVETNNGKLYIDLSKTAAGGSGANKNADTKFANLFDIINQGSQEVKVYVEDDPVDVEFGMFAEGQEDDGSLAPSGGGGGFSVGNPVTLGVGEVVENVSIAWDGSPPSTGTYTINLVADRTDPSQTSGT